MATDLIEGIARAGGPAVVLLAFVLVLGESAILLDFVIPGEVGLVVTGSAAASTGVPVWVVVIAGTLGAIAGDSVGYWLGRRFGHDIVNRWSWSRRRLKPRLERAKRHFDRSGGRTVAVARWIGPLRAVIPVVAGAAKMPYARFISWDAPSAAVWTAVVVTLGYEFGGDVAEQVDRIGTFGSLVAVALLIAVYLWRRQRHRRSGSAEAGPATAERNSRNGSIESERVPNT